MTRADIAWPRRTDRLVLRPVRPQDLGTILAYRNLRQVGWWLHKRTVDPGDYAAALLAAVDDPADHSFAAEFDGRVIGTVRLQEVPAFIQCGPGIPAPAGPAGQAELGYVLDPAYAGRGFATEMAEGALELAFSDLGLRRVVAGCYAGNLPSVRVVERLGMRREEHSIRDGYHADLGWVDGYSYAILAEEWLAARRAGTLGPPGPVRVRPATDGDDVAAWWAAHWGAEVVAVHGTVFHAADVRALVAELTPSPGSSVRDGSAGVVGLATYVVRGDACEIVSADADPPGTGVGTALVRAVAVAARAAGARRLVLTTTNDNLPALGFWQAQGFRLTALRPEAVARARRLKPEIPAFSPAGLPVRDEIDLEKSLPPT